MLNLLYTTLLPYLAGTAALAVLIVPAVSFVRAHLLTRMDGIEVPLFAGAVGTALVFGFAAAAQAAGHPVGWSIISRVAMGVFSGFWASGFVKGWTNSALGKAIVTAVESAAKLLIGKGFTLPAAGDTPSASAAATTAASGNSSTPAATPAASSSTSSTTSQGG